MRCASTPSQRHIPACAARLRTVTAVLPRVASSRIRIRSRGVEITLRCGMPM